MKSYILLWVFILVHNSCGADKVAIDLLIDVDSASLTQKLSDLEKQKSVLENDINKQTKPLAENRISETECVFAELCRKLTAVSLPMQSSLSILNIHDEVYPDRTVVIFNLFAHIRITDTYRQKTRSLPLRRAHFLLRIL